MPSSIPYDHPSLALGNVVDVSILSKLKQISKLQAKNEAALDKMNSYVSMKRSISMTINELVDLNVDVSEINKKIDAIDKSIATSANEYIEARLGNDAAIQQLKEQISQTTVDDSIESPLDFKRSIIESLPLSADSIKLDVQYFSYEKNDEGGTIASIESAIKESTSGLGAKSGDIAKAATSQINTQRKNHSIAGTLIITASCTHSGTVVFEPLVIDADKGISLWNTMFNNDKIEPLERVNMQTLASETKDNVEGENFITIISGANYGSSFVGMVHILNTEISESEQTDSDTLKLNERLKLGGWLENVSGGFGVDPSIAGEVRQLVSTHDVSSHVNLIVMGIVPTIKSNELNMGVEKFANVDPEKVSRQLATISNVTAAKSGSVSSQAEESRIGAKMLGVQNATMQTMIGGLSRIDREKNKTLDINSLMTAFENYIELINNKKGGTTFGIPINFHLKKISKSQLIKLWIDKYYPDKQEIKPDKSVSTSEKK